MQIVTPTSVKFDPELKKAIQAFADRKEMKNFSAVVKKAVVKYIRFVPKTENI